VATERIMPAVALPSPARPRPVRGRVAGPMAHPVRPAVRKKEAVLSTPTRAGMLIGASAAIYAVTLAGVSLLQSDSDAALAASRQPYLDALAATRAANDTLEAALVKADGAAQARLDELAALVAEVQGSAAALPTRISLPTVTMHGAVAGGGGGSGRAPAAKARTKASGAP